MATQSDAVILSDLHLGSELCQTDQILHFLDNLPPTKHLILLGDVLQSTEYRLKDNHWQVLSKLRELAETMEVTWIKGNHDEDADHVANLIGATFADEYVLESGNRKMLCIHGHQWDSFISSHQMLTSMAEWVYLRVQRLFPQPMMLWRNLGNKTFKRAVEKVRREATVYGAKRGMDVVVCGHVHHAEVPLLAATDQPDYFNSGSWTDLQCHFLTVKDGTVQLTQFVYNQVGDSLAAYCLAQARRVKQSLRLRTSVTNNWISQIFL